MRTAKNRIINRGVVLVLLMCTAVTLITTATAIYVLGVESWNFFSTVSVTEFLFGTEWTPLLEPKSFGVLPLVCGTFLIVIGAIVIALPFGLMVATYLSEFASERSRTIIKPVLEILAGIPTVVYGYFALTFITPLLQNVFPQLQVFNALSGAIVVGIMILPMVSSLCDDAFRALPLALREGGYALGGYRYEVITLVVFPSAASRVGASVILAVSRALGETMAVTLAAGATPKMTLNPFESIQTMTAYIVQVSLGDTPAGGVEYLTSFAVGGLLFVMTLIMNMFGNYLLTRVRVEAV